MKCTFLGPGQLQVVLVVLTANLSELLQSRPGLTKLHFSKLFVFYKRDALPVSKDQAITLSGNGPQMCTCR